MTLENAPSDTRIFDQLNTAQQNDCYLLQMPNELLEAMFTGIPMNALLNLRDTSKRLRCLVDDSRKLWASCILENFSLDYLLSPHVMKAAACGNFSAIVRIALTYKMLAWKTNYQKITEILHQLHQADMQCPSGVPFSWFFYRPLWFTNQINLSNLFDSLEAYAEANPNCHGFYCYNVASIFYCFPEMRTKAFEWFNKAAAKGVSQAAFRHWLMKYEEKQESSVHTNDIRETVASLQQIALADPRNKKVQLELCKYYTRGHYGTLNRQVAVSYVRKLFSSSYSYDPADLVKHNSYMMEYDRKLIVNEATSIITHNDLDDVMLHQSMKLFNKCMCARFIPEHCLKKLVAATLMVLTQTNWENGELLKWTSYTSLRSHFDTYISDTYTNIDLFGNIFEVTKGNLEMFTIIDYLDLILAMQNECGEVKLLSYYISNLSLMSDIMCTYPEAEIAVSSYMLARAVHLKSRNDGQSSEFVGTKSDIFPEKVAELTGISFNTAFNLLTVLNWECKLIPKSRTWNQEHGTVEMATFRFQMNHSPVEFPILKELLRFININMNEYMQRLDTDKKIKELQQEKFADVQC